MAAKYTGKRKRMGKYSRGRRVRRKLNPRRSLPLAGFPKQKLVRLRYVQELEVVTPATGYSKSLPFVANGMYDPYYPIGGHQPKGFDQWMTVYNHYNVVGSKISVKMSGTGQDNFIWGVTRTPQPNSLENQTLEYILENRYNKGYTITGTENGGYANNPTRINTIRTATYSQKKEYGKNATSTSELIGNDGANPSDITCFEVWVVPIQGQTSSKTVDFIVTIDFIALLTEPKVLDQS